MWRIRGRNWGDTLALWVNALFWLPRRFFWQLRLGSKEAAVQKLLQNPHRHWTVWPLSLAERSYWWGTTLIDAAGLIWFAKGEDQEIPPHWLRALENSRVGIDIGAHRGYWSLTHRYKLAPDAKVLLLEPDRENFTYLVRNLRYNKADFAIPLPVAAWDKAQWLTLRGQSAVEQHASFSQKVDPSAFGDTLGVRLDELLRSLPLSQVDWIKVDVEGAELQVLQGLQEVLSRFRPVLWIEVHGTWETIAPFLHDLGYIVKEVLRPENGERGHLWAEKN